MIFNINSTRGHTGSLLVIDYICIQPYIRNKNSVPKRLLQHCHAYNIGLTVL